MEKRKKMSNDMVAEAAEAAKPAESVVEATNAGTVTRCCILGAIFLIFCIFAVSYSC